MTMPPKDQACPGLTSRETATRMAQRDLRRVVTRHHAVHPDVAACAAERARIMRIRNVRLRTAALKAHVARCAASAVRDLGPPRPRGFVSRGWWYPRPLMLALFWGAIVILGGLLLFGLFTHPALQA